MNTKVRRGERAYGETAFRLSDGIILAFGFLGLGIVSIDTEMLGLVIESAISVRTENVLGTISSRT